MARNLKKSLQRLLEEDMPEQTRGLLERAIATIESQNAAFEPKPALFAPEGFFQIPGYQMYAVNRRGEVFSASKKKGLLKQWREASGHSRVELVDKKSGKRHKRYVHDLVLSSFEGPRPDGFVALNRPGFAGGSNT